MLTYRQERGDTDVQVKLLTKAFQDPMFLCFEYLPPHSFFVTEKPMSQTVESEVNQ